MNQVPIRTSSFIFLALLALLGLSSTACTDCTKPGPDDQGECEDSVLYFGEDDSSGPSAGGGHSTGGGSSSNGGSDAGGSGGASSGTDAGGTGGGGPNGGSETSTTGTNTGPVAVWTWGEEDNEGILESSEWVTDSTQGSYEGKTAVHPPAFEAGDDFEFELTCGGEDHTQLRFQMYKPSSGSVVLELQVDGEPEPRVLPTATNGWNEQVINVEPGPHTYVFKASSADDSSPRVVLDSFRCLAAEIHPAVNGEVDLDDDFIPVEITGEWQVDNLQGIHDGSAAVHPPAFEAGDDFEFELTCDAEDHTQLRFQMYKPSSGSVVLELQVDGEPEPRVLPTATNGWNEQTIDVDPPGPRTYVFKAYSEQDSSPRVVLDSFVCE